MTAHGGVEKRDSTFKERVVLAFFLLVLSSPAADAPQNREQPPAAQTINFQDDAFADLLNPGAHPETARSAVPVEHDPRFVESPPPARARDLHDFFLHESLCYPDESLCLTDSGSASQSAQPDFDDTQNNSIAEPDEVPDGPVQGMARVQEIPDEQVQAMPRVQEIPDERVEAMPRVGED